MKPSSFATIIIRFIAIYLLVASVGTALGPLLLSRAFAASSSASLGFTQVQMNSPFAGLFGIQMAIAAVCAMAGIVLYIWSRPLGRLIAAGLE